MVEDQNIPLHVRRPGMCKPFKPGSNHNPKGRPRGQSLTQKLIAFGRSPINKAGTKSYMDALVESCWKRGVAGDRHCMRLIFERMAPALQASITAHVGEPTGGDEVLEMLHRLRAKTGFLGEDEGPLVLEAEATQEPNQTPAPPAPNR